MSGTSSLLSQSENSALFQTLGRRRISLASAVVQLYLCEDNWSMSRWTKKCCGVACFVKDYSVRSYFISVVDVKHRRVVWEQELYDRFVYKAQQAFFHTFEAHTCMAGLNFASVEEATSFRSAVDVILWHKAQQARRQLSEVVTRQLIASQQSLLQGRSPPSLQEQKSPSTLTRSESTDTESVSRKKKKKKGKRNKLTNVDISPPVDFRHVSHIGARDWDVEKDVQANMQILSPETRRALEAFVQMQKFQQSVTGTQGKKKKPDVPERQKPRPQDSDQRGNVPRWAQQVEATPLSICVLPSKPTGQGQGQSQRGGTAPSVATRYGTSHGSTAPDSASPERHLVQTSPPKRSALPLPPPPPPRPVSTSSPSSSFSSCSLLPQSSTAASLSSMSLSPSPSPTSTPACSAAAPPTSMKQTSVSPPFSSPPPPPPRSKKPVFTARPAERPPPPLPLSSSTPSPPSEKSASVASSPAYPPPPISPPSSPPPPSKKSALAAHPSASHPSSAPPVPPPKISSPVSPSPPSPSPPIKNTSPPSPVTPQCTATTTKKSAPAPSPASPPCPPPLPPLPSCPTENSAKSDIPKTDTHSELLSAISNYSRIALRRVKTKERPCGNEGNVDLKNSLAKALNAVRHHIYDSDSEEDDDDEWDDDDFA